jgi:hypothetical protein
MVVRIKNKANVSTAAHEFGHFISDFVLKHPTMRGAAARGAQALPKIIKDELHAAGVALYGSRKPSGGYMEEGIAEWGRYYVIDPSRLPAMMPEFSKLMENILDTQFPELKRIMLGAREEYAKNRAASPAQRMKAIMAEGPRGAMQRILDWLGNTRLHVGRWFEDTPVLREAVELLTSASKVTPNALRDAYKMLQASRHMFSFVEEELESGVIDWRTGKPVTRGFYQIWRELETPEERHDFRAFLLAHRIVELAGRGVQATELPTSDAIDTIKALSSPKFDRLAKDIWKINDALLDQKVAIGLLTDEEAKLIRAKNERRYGPMWRSEVGEIMADHGGPRAGGVQLARNSAGVYRILGSEKNVIWPDEALALDILATAKSVQAHHAARALIAQAVNTKGGGHIATAVPAPKELVKMSLNRVKEQLIALGIDPYEFYDKDAVRDLAYRLNIDIEEQRPGAPPGQKRLRPIKDVILDILNSGEDEAGLIDTMHLQAILHAWYPARRASAAAQRDLVIPILVNGERKWFQIRDKELYDALAGVGPHQLRIIEGIFGQVAWRATRLLRAGATLTFEFMTRNWYRDAFQASIYTKGQNKKTMIPFYLAYRGVKEMMTNPALLADWKRHFGKGGSHMAQDREFMNELIEEALNQPKTRGQKVLHALKHPIKTLRTASDIIENTTRLGEFAVNREEQIAKGVDPHAASAEAAHASGDVTLRFSGGGHMARQANLYWAFLNPALLDMRKLYTEFIAAKDPERRKALAMKSFVLLTLPSLALAALQDDDEEYLAIPEWQRNAAWIWVQRGADGKVKHIWRFPKPQLLGLIFGTVPERLYLYASAQLRGDYRAREHLRSLWTGKGGAIGQQIVPNLWPTIAAGAIEWWSNKSTYRGTPIVPRSRQDLAPAYQRADYTGEAAQQFGRLTNLSPAKVENTVRVHGGTMGSAGLWMADHATRLGREAMGKTPLPVSTARKADPFTEAPILRGFTVREPLEDAQSVERFYTTYFKNEEKRQTWREMRANRETHAARAYLEKHRDEIRSVATAEETGGEPGILRQAYSMLSDMRKGLPNRPPEDRARVGRLVREKAERALAIHHRGAR